MFSINELFGVVKFNCKQVVMLGSQSSYGFDLDQTSLRTQLFDVH